MTTGLVVASFGRSYTVIHQNQRFVCVNKGKKQDVVVGDLVELSIQNETQARIEKVLTRRNLLHRSDAHKSKAFASNIDAIIWVMAVSPSPHTQLLDRALVMATSVNVPLHIVLNKTDLAAENAWKMLRPYTSIVPSITPLMHTDHAAIQAYFAQFQQQRIILLGQSGVGKSSLLNQVIPDLALKTQEISQALSSGRHTTTDTRLYTHGALSVIDSPGFQVFGLHHLSSSELAHGFAEFQNYLNKCKFYNCTHVHEPDCKIRKAVQKDAIAAARYASYCQILAENQAPGKH